MERILADLSQFIAESILQTPWRKITPSEPLISSGLLDSFHLIDLALFVEDHFGVRIDDTELNRQTFDNLEQLAKIIQERLPEQ